jgi:large subunit ribosomal protein L27
MFQPQSLARATARACLNYTPTSLSPSFSLLEAFSRLTVANTIQVRNASHASQGRANGAAPGPGKRLGAKRGASELVVPGCIIFRQRGTLWYPGENCVMGRDHTISAAAKGYVRYYKDPERHPTRKYIGVVFEQHETLPRGRNAARRRKLNMEAVIMPEVQQETEGEQLQEDALAHEVDASVVSAIAEDAAPGTKPHLTLRDGYQYRESNTSIGRSAEKAGIKIKQYKPNDRWLAWRLRNERRQRAIVHRSLRRKTKGKK